MDLGNATRIARESGFEILHQGDRIYFVNRRTFGFGLAAWIFGGLAFILGAAGVVLTATVDRRLFLMILVSILFAAVSVLCFRKYKERKNRPWNQVEDMLIADQTEGSLLLQEGTSVCRLSDIKTDIRLDPFDSSRGFMRWVILRWPGGKARIFKTNRLKKARELTQYLAGQGIGDQ